MAYLPPEVVEVACIGARDVSVGHRGVQEAKRRACSQRSRARWSGDDAGDPIPALRASLRTRKRAMSACAGCPRGALLAAEPLHLVVVSRVGVRSVSAGGGRSRNCQGARIVNGIIWPHCGSMAGQFPTARTARRMGGGRHRVRVRAPLPGLCPRGVRHLRGGAVGLPKSQHGRGRGLPRGNSILLRAAVRNFREGGARPPLPPPPSLACCSGVPKPASAPTSTSRMAADGRPGCRPGLGRASYRYGS